MKMKEITIGQAHVNTRKIKRNISTGAAVFLNRKRVNVSEHTTKMMSEFMDGATRGVSRGMDEGKLSEVNARTESTLGGTFRKLSSDAVFVVCSQTFTLFRLRKTAVPVKISRYSFRVFVCACPSVTSSIPDKSFHFPSP